MSTTFNYPGMKQSNKCRLGHKLYTVKIDYRIGDKTTKKPIGKLCPICDSGVIQNPTEFWRDFSKDKEEKERFDKNLESMKGKNPIFQKKNVTKCAECGFQKWIVCRKRIPTKDAKKQGRDLKTWVCTCQKCGKSWTQNHPKLWKDTDI